MIALIANGIPASHAYSGTIKLLVVADRNGTAIVTLAVAVHVYVVAHIAFSAAVVAMVILVVVVMTKGGNGALYSLIFGSTLCRTR